MNYSDWNIKFNDDIIRPWRHIMRTSKLCQIFNWTTNPNNHTK